MCLWTTLNEVVDEIFDEFVDDVYTLSITNLKVSLLFVLYTYRCEQYSGLEECICTRQAPLNS